MEAFDGLVRSTRLLDARAIIPRDSRTKDRAFNGSLATHKILTLYAILPTHSFTFAYSLLKLILVLLYALTSTEQSSTSVDCIAASAGWFFRTHNPDPLSISHHGNSQVRPFNYAV